MIDKKIKKPEIPKFEDILKLLAKDSSIVDAEGRELFANYQRLKKANPTVETYKQMSRYKKLIENWYYSISGLNEKIFFEAGDVLKFLKDEGYKIEKSTFYSKFIIGVRKQKDGSIFKHDVENRIKELSLDKLDGSDYEIDPAGKNQEETRLTKAKADKEELLLKVLQKRYIDIAQVERTRTAQTARLLLTYENLIYGKAEKLIELVGGDMTKKNELQTFLLGDQWFFGALREFAKKDRFVFSLPTKKMLEAIELFNDTEDTNAA